MSARDTRSAGRLLVAGTTSDAGKSIATTALCRALTALCGALTARSEPDNDHGRTTTRTLAAVGFASAWPTSRGRGRRVVVVGGGPVALRRVGALLAAQTKVTVVAHRCCGDVPTSFPCRRR
ncbi:MAG: NAD(P)-dependent oxidoreductase [Dermatophilaceae bacterium]